MNTDIRLLVVWLVKLHFHGPIGALVKMLILFPGGISGDIFENSSIIEGSYYLGELYKQSIKRTYSGFSIRVSLR